ncbi:hypothetical protein AAHA92_05141 [Salvia divinorum]|uniref:Uncharacterized protein n=1 Tax=Salvia divinorum TaxID=28513 RepID=A0ABD1I3J8_SALDI
MEDLPSMRSEIQRATTVSSLISDDFFTDIFGGAPRPRSIFSHQLSAAGGFYDDIFWPKEKEAPPPLSRRGGNLPLFDIPSLKQVSRDRNHKSRFFREISRWDAKKRSNSSSRQSSNELRPPLREGEYDDLPMSAAKLRAINTKTKWNSSINGDSDQQKWAQSSNLDCENKLGIEENVNIERMKAEIIDEEMEIDEDEFISSYVIELGSCSRETASAYVPTDVDEAIAWAKEKFHTHSSQEMKPTLASRVMNESRISSRGAEEDSSLELEIEDDRSIVDEKIRLWLSGKESDVRLLLSSLHQILWPNSGWMAIPLTKLVQSSQVKKAYQKSVLCLHPDKLQQRGASLLHKYIADKVFAALQGAWTTFTSLDVSKIY